MTGDISQLQRHRCCLLYTSVDAIAFTGGIGENATPVREAVVKSLGYLGITLDEEANQTRGENKIISTPDSKVCLLYTSRCV